ncbi:uncharacterized protein BYT42DRAFT_97048 [Radiomyces spectabilis]|uniref:uncharacterized protein n=1 Tax=Radiomyces spectabilis TaxID=64574 RepID=UPI00221E8D9C|nr:uncharacterized protein BYT42DRAFT_97048 [Radiomyces spectabilis]KAI8370652.1 hypothetical protein BYT42DRAFT_97048 [Radiomyces spectabilis]
MQTSYAHIEMTFFFAHIAIHCRKYFIIQRLIALTCKKRRLIFDFFFVILSWPLQQWIRVNRCSSILTNRLPMMGLLTHLPNPANSLVLFILPLISEKRWTKRRHSLLPKVLNWKNVFAKKKSIICSFVS